MSMFDGKNREENGWGDSGWSEYEKLVLHELESHSSNLKEIREDVSSLKIEIGMLKVKSGLWGMVGGLLALLPIAVVIIFEFVK